MGKGDSFKFGGRRFVDSGHDGRYAVAGYRGIAFSVLGYEELRDEFGDWEQGEQLFAVMVGDDRALPIDEDDLTLLADEDYCSECGQIGCKHGQG